MLFLLFNLVLNLYFLIRPYYYPDCGDLAVYGLVSYIRLVFITNLGFSFFVLWLVVVKPELSTVHSIVLGKVF